MLQHDNSSVVEIACLQKYLASCHLAVSVIFQVVRMYRAVNRSLGVHAAFMGMLNQNAKAA
jgi:hypothetical protein